jgi:hypothetical protein
MVPFQVANRENVPRHAATAHIFENNRGHSRFVSLISVTDVRFSSLHHNIFTSDNCLETGQGFEKFEESAEQVFHDDATEFACTSEVSTFSTSINVQK